MYAMYIAFTVAILAFYVIRFRRRKTNENPTPKLSKPASILVAGVLLLILFLTEFVDDDLIAPIILLGALCAVAFLVLKRKIIKKSDLLETKRAALRAYTFKKYGASNIGVLKVTERSEKAAAALEIKEIHDIIATTTPDKLVYTGATVGGITTGGFHVEQGGTSLSLGEGTGSWAISYLFGREFNGEPQSEVVSYIQLTDELFAKAKKDKYLRKLIVTEKEREKWKRDYLDRELADVPNLIHTIGDLDKDTAKRLGDWLAGREPRDY